MMIYGIACLAETMPSLFRQFLVPMTHLITMEKIYKVPSTDVEALKSPLMGLFEKCRASIISLAIGLQCHFSESRPGNAKYKHRLVFLVDGIRYSERSNWKGFGWAIYG
ncbi:hypothetical protein RYX36_015414 [Vicia faba]